MNQSRTMMTGTWILAMLVMTLALPAHGADVGPPESEITSVPGFNGGAFASRHYGGFVTLDDTTGRALYYYFVESEGNPTADPLVLWLQGGPGCSGFDAWIYEHGPFNLAPAAAPGALPSLQANPYSWSKAANMIYLDSPAGVGYSFSNNMADYITNDTMTAQDTHTFLLRWLALYPDFQNNTVYIAGESFGGVYVPTLVQHIHAGRAAGVTPDINLKGYVLGNPSTDDAVDQDSLVPFLYGMALISTEQYQAAEANCNSSYLPPYTPACLATLTDIDNKTLDINLYDILEPCYHDPAGAAAAGLLPRSYQELGRTDKELKVRKRMYGRGWPLRAGLPDGPVPSWPELADSRRNIVPCTDDTVAMAWLNDEGVRAAIHAKPGSVTGEWVLCTLLLTYLHDTGSMIPLHRAAHEQGYRALIYSGDHDLCVPYTGTATWTRGLGYNAVESWRPWYLDQQVAGFATEYDNDFTFATVMGSGHTVPEYKPAQALAMFQRWLKQEPL